MTLSLFGNALLWVSLVASLISLLAYIGVSRGRRGYLGTGRLGFGLMAVCLTAASIALLVAFLGRHFELEYVVEYSSRDLSRYYTVSAFWGGQEGGFLLWAFLGAILGVYFLLRAREDEGLGMVFLNAVQIFMLVMMLKKSPFALVSPETQMRMGMAPGSALPDGQGLNPLLQDPWMAIHPPLLFLGYAAMGIPFALALAALVRRDYDAWVARALPWTAFAWATLGSGIFVGGYWAYKVLGWGGYWGWDPVENSSLIPWLTCTALLHGMITQRAVRGMRRANMALAISSFVLVIYGSYLTRSGILDKFSNHSFANAGLGAYLLFFLVGFTALGIGLLIRRWRDVPDPGEGLYSTTTSREFAFFITVLVLSISAILVLLGTSSPLITMGLQKLHVVGKASKVDTPYYLWTNTPVGILLALLLSLCPLMAWKGKALKEFGKNARVPAVMAVAALVVAALASTESDLLSKSAMILTSGLGAFALGLNLIVLIPLLKGDKVLFSGGYVAHVGLALVLVGVIASTGYSLHRRVDLSRGQSKSAFGLKYTFQGAVADPTNPNKGTLDIRVDSGDEAFVAKPVLEANPRTGETMQRPYIKKYWLSDLYVSPQAYQPGVDSAQFTLVKNGPPTEVAGYRIRFTGFQVGQHGADNMGAMQVGAVLEISKDGKTEQVVPTMSVGAGDTKSPPVKFFGGAAAIQLNRISVEQHSATLSMAGPGIEPTPDVAVVEVSTKPLVNLVWLGTILMVLGGCIATAKRSRDARPRQKGEAEKEAIRSS